MQQHALVRSLNAFLLSNSYHGYHCAAMRFVLCDKYLSTLLLTLPVNLYTTVPCIVYMYRYLYDFLFHVQFSIFYIGGLVIIFNWSSHEQCGSGT